MLKQNIVFPQSSFLQRVLGPGSPWTMFWPGTWAGVARGHGLTSIDYASQSLHICLSSTAAINWYHTHNYTTPPYHCHGHLLAPKVCLRVRIGRPSIDWLYFNYFTETRGKDTMDKTGEKWLQLSIGSKSKAESVRVSGCCHPCLDPWQRRSISLSAI